jgi:hypothetical protein
MTRSRRNDTLGVKMGEGATHEGLGPARDVPFLPGFKAMAEAMEARVLGSTRHASRHHDHPAIAGGIGKANAAHSGDGRGWALERL